MAQNKSILIVDDELSVRQAFQVVLAEVGYEVDTVSSGKEAIERAQSKKYNLIYLDLVMPGEMDGMETLQQLKEVTPQTHIYIMTAFFEKMEELRNSQKTLKDMANQILYKPIWKEEILKRTRNAIGMSE